MNAWSCDSPGCNCKAVGVGGAIGLRAVGWWFEPGRKLFCPQHRPDKIKGDKEMYCKLKACSQCAGRKEANKWQETMYAELGL